jgi:hypothetical protein
LGLGLCFGLALVWGTAPGCAAHEVPELAARPTMRNNAAARTAPPSTDAGPRRRALCVRKIKNIGFTPQPNIVALAGALWRDRH